MRRLLFDRPGIVRWEEVDAPSLDDPDAALVRAVAVALCDLDVAALQGRYPVPGPYPLGHEGVAEVVEIGDDVTAVAPGDLVVVPFQISCGRCESCRRGRTGNCAAHPMMSTYGLGPMGGLEWGGLLGDLTRVPHADAMLVPVPTGIEPAAIASVSDNVADGWRCVAPQLSAAPGADVLVVGGPHGPRSIGLYATGLAVALGAGRVVYLDDDVDRLRIAEALGAEVQEGSPPRKSGRFEITVDASGTEAGLGCALNSTAPDGWCTSPSVYLEPPHVPMLEMYSRCCTLHTGRAHVRPAIPPILGLVTEGFDPSLVTSATVDWEDAEAALADPPMKLVLQRP
ncbi:MAG: alcohol dehydrogenase catalytic domain-containing protein [Actinomycetota bacterium]